MMKQLKYFFSFLLISISLFAQEVDCTYNGKQLYGRVKIVEHFPDITIQMVERNADIDVKIVEYPAKRCGEWQLVEHFETLRVEIVEHNADIRVRFVKYFPGLKK